MQDEKRDPLHRGYSRVETADGSLSNSSTSTSLDTVVIESAKDSTLLSGGTKTAADQSQQNTRVPFSPILETEDTDISALNNLSITSNSSTLKTFENPLLSNLKKASATNISRPSLKGSKVSFEQPDNDSDDSFEDRRGHFQQKKSLSSSATDRKGILKVSRHWNNPPAYDPHNKITPIFVYFRRTGSQKFEAWCWSPRFPIEETRIIRYKKFQNSGKNSRGQLIRRGIHHQSQTLPIAKTSKPRCSHHQFEQNPIEIKFMRRSWWRIWRKGQFNSRENPWLFQADHHRFQRFGSERGRRRRRGTRGQRRFRISTIEFPKAKNH